MSEQNDLQRLVEAHHVAVYRYAHRLTGTVADAEDLTQQTFLIAQQHWAQVREAASARGWLLTVLRRAFLKRLRKPAPIPASSLEIDVEACIPETTPETRIDGERLQAALADLPDEFRVVVLMFYFEERSYREIATELGVPLGTVMSRLSRAKNHLRRQLLAPVVKPLERAKVSRQSSARSRTLRRPVPQEGGRP